MTFPDPRHDHSRCTAALLNRAEQTCHERGSRLTGQRRDILECVARAHSAVGAYDIIDRMAEKGPRPAPITVYRALDFLLDHNLVHKVESRNAYVACSCSHDLEPAMLLICEGCGTVSESVRPAVVSALKAAAAAEGFTPRAMVIEVSGRCSTCGGAA